MPDASPCFTVIYTVIRQNNYGGEDLIRHPGRELIHGIQNICSYGLEFHHERPPRGENGARKSVHIHPHALQKNRLTLASGLTLLPRAPK
jgi:hypothetical protein